MIKRIFKRYDLSVAVESSTVSQTFELDKNIHSVHGVLVTSSHDDLLYYRGSQRIELNRDELFPQNYESKLLMSGVNVSPNRRYYETGALEPGNYKLKVDYTDTIDMRTEFVPYRVSVYLEVELKEEI